MRAIAAPLVASFLLSASSAMADDAHVLNASVKSYESAEDLTKMTCELTAVADVGGHARLFDVSVDGKRCSSVVAEADAIPLRVRIEPHENDFREVVFEADVPEGVTDADMRAALGTVASELYARVNPYTPKRRVAREHMPQKKRASRASGIALVSIGASGLGAGAVLGVVTFFVALHQGFCGVFDGSCDGPDPAGFGIAAGISAGMGAALLVTGLISLASTPQTSGVSVHVGPTGLRVTF
jgi:hypothetical protein